jgi:AcrR family transcriptional regulator
MCMKDLKVMLLTNQLERYTVYYTVYRSNSFKSMIGEIHMNEKDTAKQRLVDVTTELICQGKKPHEITVADITERAGVGNGMVNYHFQSKDNLLRTAVKRVMECAKNHLSEKLNKYIDATAADKLTIILKETTKHFVENPEICKIAIMDNLENEPESLHLLSDFKQYNQCIKEIFGDDSCKVWIANCIIAGFLNYSFLKADALKKETKFDFYDETQRNEAINRVIKTIYTTDIHS